MLKYFFLFFIFLFLNTSVIAQNPINRNPTAGDYIRILRDGVLLVKLNTAQNKIDALNKMGKTAWAQRIAREQAAENQRLIDAFKQFYTFSPVYFFYAYDSKKIIDKQFEGILFDANLQPAFTNDTFPGRFLVAEYGLIGQNQSRLTRTGKRVDDATENSTIEGLVISDENLIQLSDPFPYFMRSFKSLGKDLSRTEDRMVEKLNKKLIAFSKNNPGHYQTPDYTSNKPDEVEHQEIAKKENTKGPGIIASILLAIGRVLNSIF